MTLGSFSNNLAGAPFLGTRMSLWKQDPLIDPIGPSVVLLPHPVFDGPSDDKLRVEIEGGPVLASRGGDFIFDPTTHETECDAVHTYAAARLTLNLYQRSLRQVFGSYRFEWPWGENPLTLRPRAGGGNGIARYVREARAIDFFSFQSVGGRHPGRVIHACQSFDIVAHEMGHAILDALQPAYHQSGAAGDLVVAREAFADLTVLFAVLSRFDLCERVVVESRGDLCNHSLVTGIAEQVGEALRESIYGLRILRPNRWSGENSASPHHASLALTSCVYEVLRRLYARKVQESLREPAEVLFVVARCLRMTVLKAFLALPPESASLKRIGEAMLAHEPSPAYRRMISEELERVHLL